MKQSTSATHFGGIPLDTNTLAGQWMTFNHMANHYRKLLNVKPRVNTGLPSGASSGNIRGSYHNLATNSKMIQSSKPGKKKKNSTNSNNTSNSATANNTAIHTSRHNRDSLMYGSHPDRLNTTSSSIKAKTHDNIELTIKSPLKHGRSKKKALTSHYPEYQVVFGPSSIRSSSDAFMTDEDTASTISTENNKPPSDVQAPIGVTEKIRSFLNHIHHLDLSNSTPKPLSKKSKRVTTAPLLTPTSSSVVTAEKPTTVSSVPTGLGSRHQARHSKCFLPYEPPSPNSPRKCMSSSVPIGGAPQRNQLPKKHKQLPSGTLKIAADDDHFLKFSKSAHHLNHPNQYQQSPKLARNKFTGSGSELRDMVPEKEFHVVKKPKSRKRADSIASIGTICGSEELTTEDDHVNISDIFTNLELKLDNIDSDEYLVRRIMEDDRKQSKKSPRKVLHEQDQNRHREIRICSSSSGNLVKSSSVASLIPSTSNDGGGGKSFAKQNRHHGYNSHDGAEGVVAGMHIQQHGNNKDSSRDSAYGFSSGESRITTRESTPEKKCLSGSGRLLKSHVEFEKPCKDVQTSATSLTETRHGKSSKDGHRQRMGKSTSTRDLRRRESHDRYICFLTEMTQDVVRKGIYTNKGLKTLFKSHLEQNRELNPNKLADMVERLRMDLGIPKDDSLDKIEFGYGSVTDASSTKFFYTPSAVSCDKLSTESIIHNANTTASSSAASMAAAALEENLLEDPPSSHASSPSPTTIIPQVAEVGNANTSTTTGFSSSGGDPNTSSNRSSTTGTTEDGSGAGDFISVPDDSEDNFITTADKHGRDHHLEDDDEDEGNVHNDDDELSLSETEVSQYLKVAGLDDGTMQSVMGILKS